MDGRGNASGEGVKCTAGEMPVVPCQMHGTAHLLHTTVAHWRVWQRVQRTAKARARVAKHERHVAPAGVYTAELRCRGYASTAILRHGASTVHHGRAGSRT